MTERDNSLKRLGRTARWTRARLRFDEVLGRAALLLPIPLVYAVGALTWIKIARPQPETQQVVLLAGLAPLMIFVAGVLHAALRRRPPHRGSLALDRHHDLHDRITSAISFSQLPPDQRTPMMEIAIDDAVRTSQKLSPRKAAPLHFPRELLVTALLVVGLVAISLLEVRTVRVLPPETSIDPLVMSPDDIELFRDMAEELAEQNQDPETLAAVRRFNQLIEDIAERRLERREVFKRLAELERDLAKSSEADKDALEEGLKSAAKELEKSDLTKPIAKGMKENRLDDAEEAMRELAKKLKNKQDPPSKQQLEKMREALKKASRTSSERMKRIEQRRKELEEKRKRLLNKKKKEQLSKQEKKELEKNERRLERLDREKSQAKKSQQQMSQLDKELAEAARKLMEDMGGSSENLQQGAEDINRMAKKQMSDKEKQELLRRIKEMRELLRQQGKGGKDRLQRLLRFGERARGGQPQAGRGQKGQGEDGKGQKPGGSQPGRLVMGPGGSQSIPMPGQGTKPGGSGKGLLNKGGKPGGDKPGQGAGQGGQEAGVGHDPNLKGDKSELRGQTQDVTAVAQDTGEGAASSEVIYGAAQRGFTGRGYKKVYTDYKTVAESVIEKDEIPPGYRFYVQRYFQLIRPRE